MDPLAAKIESVRTLLRERGSAIVAFSGGVDSALVLRIASDCLPGKVLAVTARSPAVPTAEIDEARTMAAEFGVAHRVFDTEELQSPGYVANGPDRCYHCKTELFGRLEELRAVEGYAVVVDGTNADDLGDHRPGWKARRENAVLSPLVEASFGKTEIREASARFGLPTADKPAMACLASRVPYGTAVTREVLDQVGAAEIRVRELGFRQFRVRHHGEVARLEVDPVELGRFLDPAMREAVVGALREVGYRWISLDLEGYRSGSLNEGLVTRIVPIADLTNGSGPDAGAGGDAGAETGAGAGAGASLGAETGAGAGRAPLTLPGAAARVDPAGKRPTVSGNEEREDA